MLVDIYKNSRGKYIFVDEELQMKPRDFYWLSSGLGIFIPITCIKIRQWGKDQDAWAGVVVYEDTTGDCIETICAMKDEFGTWDLGSWGKVTAGIDKKFLSDNISGFYPWSIVIFASKAWAKAGAWAYGKLMSQKRDLAEAQEKEELAELGSVEDEL